MWKFFEKWDRYARIDTVGRFFLVGFSLAAVKGGYSLVAVHEFLTAVASLIVEHGLQSVWASVVAARGLSSCVPGLWSTGSVLVTHRLNCPAACGILPDQGLSPCLLH